MAPTSTSLTCGLLLWPLCVVLVAAPAQSSTLELVENSIVDEKALTFASGPATRFSNTVNGRTHQQAPLTTYQNYQYVTYFDAERRVCIGRRKLPSGSWEVIQFDDHRLESNDSHNAAVLGICEKDGTIHMAFDHHATRLNYRVSKLGAAHDPESVNWNAELFGPVTHSLGSVATDERVTYPRFFQTPSGNLMLYYRAVTSGNGDGMIEEYDGGKHDWTPGLGKFIARDIGVYADGGRTSLTRCPYMNSLSYAGKRLHASWVWRDRFERTNPRNQHDLCYAYSDDHGRTWHNSAGAIIGETGKEFIHLDSPGLVVASIPCGSGLTNSNTHYAYDDGSIHVVLRHRRTGSWQSGYHHYWRSSEGTWNREMLPFTGDRPKLVGAADRSLILLFTDQQQVHIAQGRPDADQTRWQWTDVELPSRHSICGEALLDLQRWESERVLSIYGQEDPTETIRTQRPEPADGLPSPLYVVEYRLAESATRPTDSGFVSLFDGASLRGWIGDEPFWTVRNGGIVGEITPETKIKKNRFLIYQGEIPADFELIAEYRISQHGNSGINYRSEQVEGIDFLALRGYQCDIDGRNRYTGSNYEERGRTTLASIGESVVIPPVEASDTLKNIKRNRWTAGVREGFIAPKAELQKAIQDGQWNVVRIVANGNLLQHYVNGQLMSQVKDNDLANRRLQGQLGVQVHVGPPMTVEFRNLRVRPLD